MGRFVFRHWFKINFVVDIYYGCKFICAFTGKIFKKEQTSFILPYLKEKSSVNFIPETFYVPEEWQKIGKKQYVSNYLLMGVETTTFVQFKIYTKINTTN